MCVCTRETDRKTHECCCCTYVCVCVCDTHSRSLSSRRIHSSAQTHARPAHAEKRKEPDATGADRSCGDAAVGALSLLSRLTAAPEALFECVVTQGDRGTEASRQGPGDGEHGKERGSESESAACSVA